MEILTPNSVYFSTSEPKAKLMTRYSREMTLVNGDSSDLTKKKVNILIELMMLAFNEANKKSVNDLQKQTKSIVWRNCSIDSIKSPSISIPDFCCDFTMFV